MGEMTSSGRMCDKCNAALAKYAYGGLAFCGHCASELPEHVRDNLDAPGATAQPQPDTCDRRDKSCQPVVDQGTEDAIVAAQMERVTAHLAAMRSNPDILHQWANMDVTDDLREPRLRVR